MTPADTAKVAEIAGSVALLRAKMGPLLRSDSEAIAMLQMLTMNPAVQAFARAHLTKETPK